jgi:signal transduction histidine kinase
MSATPSLASRHWVEIFWVAWIAINVVATILVPAGTTVPFHFIWLSLAVVYGVRLWAVGKTLWVLTAISAVSAFALVAALLRSHQGLDEAAEVPMMASLFLAMVWYASRWKQATEELSLASARERDFVRDASHQLRTPITVARGHVELVRDGVPSAETIDEDLTVVLGELDRLARISDRLLILATSDRVKFLALGQVELSRVVAATMHRWRTTAERDWQLHISARGTVQGDPERIESALDALIENAVKATGPGDRIAVELRAAGDKAIIEVADDGVGIEPEDLTRIFDRFWRSTQQSGRASGGTGLGLAIVKTIAEAHGGSVRATSRTEGGAIFQIELPGFVCAPPSGRSADDEQGGRRVRERPALAGELQRVGAANGAAACSDRE